MYRHDTPDGARGDAHVKDRPRGRRVQQFFLRCGIALMAKVTQRHPLRRDDQGRNEHQMPRRIRNSPMGGIPRHEGVPEHHGVGGGVVRAFRGR